MEEYQKRVVVEKEELDKKLVPLQKFLYSETFETIPYMDQHLLLKQEAAMLEYSSVLAARIARFT